MSKVLRYTQFRKIRNGILTFGMRNLRSKNNIKRMNGWKCEMLAFRSLLESREEMKRWFWKCVLKSKKRAKFYLI